MRETAGPESAAGPNGRPGPHRPGYDHRVSLGNILSILAMLAAISAAFFEIRGDLRELRVTVHYNMSRLTRVENRVGLGAYARPPGGPGDIQ